MTHDTSNAASDAAPHDSAVSHDGGGTHETVAPGAASGSSVSAEAKQIASTSATPAASDSTQSHDLIDLTGGQTPAAAAVGASTLAAKHLSVSPVAQHGQHTFTPNGSGARTTDLHRTGSTARGEGTSATQDRARKAREAARAERALQAADPRDPFRGHPDGTNPRIDAASTPDAFGIERNALGQRVIRVDSSARTGHSAPELLPSRLLPDTVYIVDGGRWGYLTNSRGDTAHWEAHIDEVVKQTSANRKLYQQRQVGKPDRRAFDHGGHHAAARFGAPPEAVNLAAMHGEVNNGAYGVMEDGWANHIEAATARGEAGLIDAHGEVVFPDGSRRPELFRVKDRWDNGDWNRFREFENPETEDF